MLPTALLRSGPLELRAMSSKQGTRRTPSMNALHASLATKLCCGHWPAFSGSSNAGQVKLYNGHLASAPSACSLTPTIYLVQVHLASCHHPFHLPFRFLRIHTYSKYPSPGLDLHLHTPVFGNNSESKVSRPQSGRQRSHILIIVLRE